MKHTIKCQAVLLNTDDYPAIAQSVSHIEAFGAKRETLYGWVDCAIRTPHTLKHLYITCDKPITDGDWYIGMRNGALTLAKYRKSEALFSDWKKVIASTDLNLELPSPTVSFIEDWCNFPDSEIVIAWEYSPSRTYGITGDFTTREVDAIDVDENGNAVCCLVVKEEAKLYTKDEVKQLLLSFGQSIMEDINENDEYYYKPFLQENDL